MTTLTESGPDVAARWMLRQLEAPKQDFRRIIARAVREPASIRCLVEFTNAASAPVKFGSAKALKLLAEAEPELVYPHFDFFASQLDNPNSILRWNAAATLANLAAADRLNKLDALLDKYLGVIDGPEMIAAAIAMQGAAVIARAKPHLAGRLASAITRVRRARYKTEECRNVAAGHAIIALGKFLDLVEDRAGVVEFVKQEMNDSRPATRKKAEAFLRKHNRGEKRATPTTRRRASA